MTISDTSMGTISTLFFEQTRSKIARPKETYKKELSKILESYAPEASLLYRQRFATYR